MKRSACLVGLAVVFAVGSAWSQVGEVRDVAPPPTAAFPAGWYPADSDVEYTTPPVKGAPYRGVMVITTADRDPATRHAVEYRQQMAQMRDSAGRKRTETSLDGPGLVTEGVMVEKRIPAG